MGEDGLTAPGRFAAASAKAEHRAQEGWGRVQAEPSRPVVAVTLGDAAGIGPELVARLLASRETRHGIATLLIGDPWLWAAAQSLTTLDVPTVSVSSTAEARSIGAGEIGFLAVDSIAESEVRIGEIGAATGRGTLDVLTICLDGALAGHIDAICFAPLNKASMKAGGLAFEDELHFFADYLDAEGYICEFNTLGDLWTSRLSSHVPLKDIFELITPDRIEQAVALTARTLREAGYTAPRIAVAALNPHGGDAGTCGREEIEIIAPTVGRLNAQGIATEGPYPADTIFRRARDGDLDAIVTMYHDQGQIAIKLMGFERGVTVQGGLPVPITTPAHGTAFDIAGQGIANVGPMAAAFALASRMAANRHRAPLVETVA